MTKQKDVPSKRVSSEFPCLRRMALKDLRPADYNPRVISPEAIGRLTKSLSEFGNLQPITFNVRTGSVLGGHQRLKCLLAMGHAETDVWCVDLDPEREKAANLVLNASAGEWDEGRLTDILRELQGVELDMDLTGFTPQELDRLLAGAPPVEPPADFPSVDESIPVEHRCPKCGYEWSGKPA